MNTQNQAVWFVMRRSLSREITLHHRIGCVFRQQAALIEFLHWPFALHSKLVDHIAYVI